MSSSAYNQRKGKSVGIECVFVFEEMLCDKIMVRMRVVVRVSACHCTCDACRKQKEVSITRSREEESKEVSK